MGILRPDSIVCVGGAGTVSIMKYLITEHNPNGIDMPTGAMDPIGITIHNTDWIHVSAETTPAEQYTRATVNGNMKDVRVHYYVDDTCAWQGLPLNLPGWHAADGDGDGNRRTIAIECIMSPAYNDTDKKSEDNCARLAAALLRQYGFGIDRLYTHQHWYNAKYCPAYILPHWDAFRAKVEGYLGQDTDQSTKQLYRIRKTWDDVKSQVGAFKNIEGAKASCPDGYSVFDESGTIVYPIASDQSNSGSINEETVSNQNNSGTINLEQLSTGSKGKIVKILQSLLITMGYSCGTCGADSDFGNGTRGAVINFQREHGLSVDGIVGPLTWAALLK